MITATTPAGQVVFKGQGDKTPQATPAQGQVAFDAVPGELRLRVDVDNAAGRSMDSVDSVFTVPDFTAVGAQISTPVIFAGHSAYDLQQVRAAADPMPATERTFSRTEQLLIRFHAYGPAGTVPAIAMRLLGRNGNALSDLPAPKQRDAGAFEAQLGLGSFPPGDYLIEISANAGGDVAKSLVAIRVTG
jgi:hypothetical protein